MLAHPAGLAAIPTSANKEDHVGMSMTAAFKTERALARAPEAVIIEILCACQAIDLLASHAGAEIVAIAELIATEILENGCGQLVKGKIKKLFSFSN